MAMEVKKKRKLKVSPSLEEGLYDDDFFSFKKLWSRVVTMKSASVPHAQRCNPQFWSIHIRTFEPRMVHCSSLCFRQKKNELVEFIYRF